MVMSLWLKISDVMDPISNQELSTQFQSVPIVARASRLCLSSPPLGALAIVKQVQQMMELVT